MKKSITRRLTALATAGIMVAGMLTGCGGGSQTPATTAAAGGDSGTATTAAAAQPEAPAAPAAGSEGKQEINVWHYFGTESIQLEFQKFVDEYNAQCDTAVVKVTVLPIADFKKQLSMSAVADSLPD